MSFPAQQLEAIALPTIPLDRPLAEEEIANAFGQLAQWKRQSEPTPEQKLRYKKSKHAVLHKDLIQRIPAIDTPVWALQLRENLSTQMTQLSRKMDRIEKSLNVLNNRFVRMDNRGSQNVHFPWKVADENAGVRYSNSTYHIDQIEKLSALECNRIFDFYGNELAEIRPSSREEKADMIIKFLNVYKLDAEE